jgi:phosphoribosylformylglycinamidine synthase
MVLFFKGFAGNVLAVQVKSSLQKGDIQKLEWLFDGATHLEDSEIAGIFVGPRREMITPWSTNAVEITQNMGVPQIIRIEEFFASNNPDPDFDPMLQAKYDGLSQHIFTIDKQPEAVVYIENIPEYNKSEGLALSDDEVAYLESLSVKLGRKLSDSEVFGFSQVNSEHCRHKIFNGTFIIDGVEKEMTLFQLIKKTSKENPNYIVSAYKDNVAFISGPVAEQFAPLSGDKPDFFAVKDIDTVISLKAETHNFPTTVEPFNGAATGTGGEIRDRLAGGKGSLPIAGTAVYMTSYPRNGENRDWEKGTRARKWLYQTPEEILVKASNGASDFGNKFGQPLICGSLLTFEHFENGKKFGFDKVIMQAGGVGFGKLKDAQKAVPVPGEKIVVLGGDNYRIGMGGGAVSSVATGEYGNSIELNAVQRSNPEMQKRVANAIRALVEADENPIVSMHDHGAGGHLNCLSELVDATGGTIQVDKLPVGDPTLSSKEIIGNESQERMGLVMREEDVDLLKRIADRERAPMYVVGEATGDHVLTFAKESDGTNPIHLKLEDMFGNPPKTVLTDTTLNEKYAELEYSYKKLEYYIEQVLQLESVACKDWLTNKVDRSVTGKVATQQCAGELHLPLNNLGVVALDYQGVKGIATSIGHAPASALVDPAKGSVLSVAEALTNVVWAPLTNGLKSVSLSANWMWPAKNPGENAKLYAAVEALSNFVCKLGINVPTGKDSMSMTQKYPDGDVVYSPGTVIISSVAEVSDISKTVKPVLNPEAGSMLVYIDFSKDKMQLGGSSFAQVLNKLGTSVPTIKDDKYFMNAFAAIQELVENQQILAGHDISAGGLITALLEMNFANSKGGLKVDLNTLVEKDVFKLLFSENPAVLIQVNDDSVMDVLRKYHLDFYIIGEPIEARKLIIEAGKTNLELDIDKYRDIWFRSSFLLDQKQSGKVKARERYESYKKHLLKFDFLSSFDGTFDSYGIDPKRRENTGIKAAIIREKGVNGDREMAYSMYLAGFDVKDVHITDLVSGRETLEDVNLIVFVGGFSNSDVLGSAKGWAGAFLYNPKAKEALDNFYKRKDTLSLGVCNGCQLMVELGLIYPAHEKRAKMLHNESHKFESGFVNVNILPNQSVMLGSLSGSRLGVWVAHGEGKFSFPYAEEKYCIPMKYSYASYPANPNGSDFNTAAICSEDGRHLAMMPHLERAIFPWQWAHYEESRATDQLTPWIEAFVNAKEWIKNVKK